MTRRSGASLEQKLPDPPTFFLDRNLGKYFIANALRQAGALVQVHDNHFSSNARDDEWLPKVGDKGWVVLTSDKRIRHRALELKALMDAKVRVFVLASGNLQGQEMAEVFVAALPAMKKFLEKHKGPFIARLTRRGDVSIINDDPAVQRKKK